MRNLVLILLALVAPLGSGCTLLPSGEVVSLVVAHATMGGGTSGFFFDGNTVLVYGGGWDAGVRSKMPDVFVLPEQWTFKEAGEGTYVFARIHPEHYESGMIGEALPAWVRSVGMTEDEITASGLVFADPD